MSESEVEGEVLSFWPNRVPNQIRFADGHVDNYCEQCGKPLDRWEANPGGTEFRHYPEHDLGCDVRSFTVGEGQAAMSDAEFAEYMRSKKPA